ncbi:Ger(x)C family spore germination protein [Evansella cellulosilytica]|uniref:Germination protein, Ger(X)C family n=1 Tax=Evansella cellulosilytica (strain ATCC 21833 / DSM 2522 / FERM P-1141 / JCM 9156 / N-4) TaxID=649639 RepID=E6TQG6_EVAC2|nr:Ger(x)C family spore germination protein [Evansella cellulosilytica]ADU29344.1 germination protein, Ger(x)C family [Evansella cellulosilytica DSM 2522]
MKKYFMYINIVIGLFLLTACWDQLLLKDVNLIYSLGIDKTDEGQFNTTVSIPKEGSSEKTSPSSYIISAEGRTLRESRTNVDNALPGSVDSSKIRVILIDQALAKIDLYTVLDVLYRDARAPLSSRVAITVNTAEDLIRLNIESAPLVSTYYIDLIEGAEQDTIVPRLNLQYICPVMLDIGKDFNIPLLKIDKQHSTEKARVIGTALFDDKKMTGTLSVDESIMANLLSDKKGKTEMTSFITTIDGQQQELTAFNHISYQIDEYKSKIAVTPAGNSYTIDLNLEVYLNVTEYPPDHLNEKSTIVELNSQIQEELQELAVTTVAKLQEAKCDLLGIGRELMAYHHYKIEDGKEWKEVYGQLPINVNVQAEIIHHGIIN